ncbi:hypothetical protein DUNSADRAFT_12470 [Dunaliella salina]|uniref:Uncharacterized protein n=1 Tax=Dunaliella salina TaxID=3046 RepID=A0ABQ7H3V8_DUNSA|nr:hypothetical protein DUNSADRAFT_12470 [Dunaliella salina]|eukprot:KAF5841542.1 hypothetical protein DUNSADRAFT_12470 [Dunaliella salina]
MERQRPTTFPLPAHCLQVSLWDVRQGARGGLIQRTSVAPGGSPVFDLAWCKAQGGLLGAAGAERAVTLLEPRKGFGVVHKWSGCAKYTIHHLEFSGLDPHWAYVAGLDSEVVCGRWDRGGASCSGNSNSSTGGHGRAAGPAQMRESKENESDGHRDAAHPRAGSGNIKFRGPARWSGMSLTATSACNGGDAGHDFLVAATQMHHIFLLDVAAQ